MRMVDFGLRLCGGLGALIDTVAIFVAGIFRRRRGKEISRDGDLPTLTACIRRFPSTSRVQSAINQASETFWS